MDDIFLTDLGLARKERNEAITRAEAAEALVAELQGHQDGWMDRAFAAEAEAERLREALADIAQATNADDPESYRSDDREGCLDWVYAKATAFLVITQLAVERTIR
jgi:hypothetical protein